MKKPLFYVVSLLLTIAFAMVSCSKDKITLEELDPDPEPKDEYMVICEKAAEVHEQVLKIYDECNSIEDLEAQEDKIRAIENVEDVYFSNTSMFVDIKDFRTVSYSFYPEPTCEETQEEFVKQVQEIEMRMTRSEDTNHPLMELKKVAILNQNINDEGRLWMKGVTNEIEHMFLKNRVTYGFHPVVINGPHVDFFQNEIFQYDIIYLITHGIYDSKKNLHWLATSEGINDDNSNKKWYELSYKYKNYPKDEISFNCVTELRNKDSINITYAMISDIFIENQKGRFQKDAVIYNNACQSMKGPNPNTKDSINYRMAEAFINKGAAAYFGYDESDGAGTAGGMYLLQRFISGMSLENSYKNLPGWVVHDYRTDEKIWADLIPYYNPSCTNINHSTLTRPLLDEVEIETKNNLISIILKAQSILHFEKILTRSDDRSAYKFEPNYNDYPSFRYGFELSENEFFKNVQKKEMGVGYENCEFENDAVTYSWTLEYKPGQTNIIKPDTYYFVRAYFYDGYSTYYSDMKYFKTPKFENGNITGGGSLPDVPGTDF